MKMVSIIIPIYNGEKYIAFCLESILGQTYQDYEVIVVDDGSTDNSGRICEEYALSNPRVKVFHRENAGVSASRNFGIDQATGKYILFVDADDTIETEMLGGCVKLAEMNEASLVICSFRYHFIEDKRMEDNSIGQDFCGTNKELFDNWFTLLVEKEILNPPWNKFVRKDLLINNRIRFNEEYSICEDMAFSVQCIKASKKIALTGKIYYNYFLKSFGTLVFKFHENYFEALTYFYESAYGYCLEYKRNDTQLKCINTLYVNMAIMFLKRISLESHWDRQRMYEKMKEIRNDKRFLSALKNTGINKKKKVVCFLLLRNQFYFIYLMYQLKNGNNRNAKKEEGCDKNGQVIKDKT